MNRSAARPNPRSFTGLALAIVMTLGACTQPATQTVGSDDPNVLATFDGGAITMAEVDQTILERPTEERQAFGVGTLDAYRDVLRELAIERLLVAGGRAAGTDQDPSYRAQIRANEREALVQQWLPAHLPPLEMPTPEELRARYDANPDAFAQPERRLVLNIFRRRSVDSSGDALLEEMASVQRQVLAGASFGTLASEISESETRHQNGLVGWFERGQLAPSLEAVVFALDEGVPSDPIRTRDGVHLFYIETILPQQEVTFEEARETIRQRILEERNEAALVAFEETIEPPPDAFLPSPEALRDLLSQGKPETVVLRLGDFSLEAGRFRTLLAEVRQETNAQTATPPAIRLLDRVRRRELSYLHLRDEGSPLADRAAAAVAKESERLLADQHLGRLVDSAIEADPAALQSFYDTHRQRFAPAVRWTLQRLLVPLSSSAQAHMQVLEGADPANATAVSLDSLATQLGGRVESLENRNLASLYEIDEKLGFHVSSLDDGERSPPYRTRNAIELIEVVERTEPIPPPFERVRDEVQASYRTIHGQTVVDTVMQDLLTNAKFQIAEDRLAAWVAAGAAPSAGTP